MILINILVAILFAGLGVCAGIIYMCVKNIKDLNEILAGVEKLEAEYKKGIELSDGVIKRLELIAELRLSLNNLYAQDLSLIRDRLRDMIEKNDFSGLNDLCAHIAIILSDDDDDEPEEGSSDE